MNNINVRRFKNGVALQQINVFSCYSFNGPKKPCPMKRKKLKNISLRCI